MNASEFYDLVRETLNRGSTLDGVLPHYVQMAVRDVERQYPFSFLDWWADFEITKDVDQVISLPVQLRSIEWLRINTADDGDTKKWEYLKKQRSAQRTINRKARPERYWVNARACLVLDAVPDKTYDAEIRAKIYTDFPSDLDSTDGHWTLDDSTAVTALHSRTMMLMSPFIREDDPNIFRAWQNVYVESVNALIREESDWETSGEEPQMEYWPEHIPYSRAFRDEED